MRMDENPYKNVSPWQGLLENYKQLEERSAFKSTYQYDGRESDFNNFNTANSSFVYKETPMLQTSGRVYVNPNYPMRQPVTHMNSRIHVNPRVIQNMNCQNQEVMTNRMPQTQQAEMPINIQSKNLVHINPKLMTNFISKVPEEEHSVDEKHPANMANEMTLSNIPVEHGETNSSSNETNTLCSEQNKSADSIISGIKEEPVIPSIPITQRPSVNYIIKSKTKLVRNSSNKSPNASLIIISQRKLVRTKKNQKLNTSGSLSKSSTSQKRKLSSSSIEKLKTSPKKPELESSSLAKSIDQYRANWYNKVDRTAPKLLSPKKKMSPSKKISNSTNLVSIDGVLYRTSRNQLIRSNSMTAKIKQECNSDEQDQNIGEEGAKLLKIDATAKVDDDDPDKVISSNSLSPVKSYKANASNKVKQRSLQILRNKMRKNNQPCLLYQRYGFCAREQIGICPKVHDKKQVAVCRKFLQGKCLLDNCALSHDVGPEKMPTCKYFLEGCCARDGCPYLHVKVSSKSPICVEFLRGYCPRGNECQKRHILICPEFDKSGKCSKGKFCPYPHKSNSTATKRIRVGSRSKHNLTNAKITKTNESPVVESRKRYYDETSEDLSKKRDKLLKYVNIMKEVHENQTSDSCGEIKIKVEKNSDGEENQETVYNKPRRPPLGPLPAYIPID